MRIRTDLAMRTAVLFLLGCSALASGRARGGEGQAGRVFPERVAAFDGVVVTGDEVRDAVIAFVSSPALEQRVANKFLQRAVFRAEAARLGRTVGEEDVAALLRAWAAEAGGRDAVRRRFDADGLGWFALSVAARDHLELLAIVRARRDLPGGADVSPAWLRETAAELMEAYAPRFHGFARDVVGTVGGQDLTARDRDRFFVACLSEAFWRERIEQIVAARRVLHAAEARGIELSPLDLERAEARLRRQVAREADRSSADLRMSLEGLLGSRGMSADGLKASTLFRAQAAILVMIRSDLTDEALRELFGDIRERFRIVRARHILFAFDPDEPYAEREVPQPLRAGARKRAAALVAILRAETDYPAIPAARFAELARVHSECPLTRDRGGDLLYLIRDAALRPLVSPAAYRLDFGADASGRSVSPISVPSPAIGAAVFSLADGEASEPVETRYGLHVLYREAGRLPRDWRSVEHALREVQIRRRSRVLLEELATAYPARIFWKPWSGRE